MNEKQAKILKNKKSIPEYSPHWKAVGYLEGIEKGKDIAGVLRQIFQNPDRMCNEDFTDLVAEVLDTWEHEK